MVRKVVQMVQGSSCTEVTTPQQSDWVIPRLKCCDSPNACQHGRIIHGRQISWRVSWRQNWVLHLTATSVKQTDPPMLSLHLRQIPTSQSPFSLSGQPKNSLRDTCFLPREQLMLTKLWASFARLYLENGKSIGKGHTLGPLAIRCNVQTGGRPKDHSGSARTRSVPKKGPESFASKIFL